MRVKYEGILPIEYVEKNSGGTITSNNVFLIKKEIRTFVLDYMKSQDIQVPEDCKINTLLLPESLNVKEIYFVVSDENMTNDELKVKYNEYKGAASQRLYFVLCNKEDRKALEKMGAKITDIGDGNLLYFSIDAKDKNKFLQFNVKFKPLKDESILKEYKNAE